MFGIAEECGEARAGVEARKTQPVDGSVPPHQGGRVRVAEHRIVLYGGTPELHDEHLEERQESKTRAPQSTWACSGIVGGLRGPALEAGRYEQVGFSESQRDRHEKLGAWARRHGPCNPEAPQEVPRP